MMQDIQKLSEQQLALQKIIDSPNFMALKKQMGTVPLKEKILTQFYAKVQSFCSADTFAEFINNIVDIYHSETIVDLNYFIARVNTGYYGKNFGMVGTPQLGEWYMAYLDKKAELMEQHMAGQKAAANERAKDIVAALSEKIDLKAMFDEVEEKKKRVQRWQTKRPLTFEEYEQYIADVLHMMQHDEVLAEYRKLRLNYAGTHANVESLLLNRLQDDLKSMIAGDILNEHRDCISFYKRETKEHHFSEAHAHALKIYVEVLESAIKSKGLKPLKVIKDL